MEFFIISMLNGLSYGLLLFMLSSGLTLIFSMMGVLNFAHASFYMVGAYVGYTVSRLVGFWPALVIAPLVVGALGAVFERLCLRRVHKFGHVPELLITFGLSYVILELVQLIWGRIAVEFRPPELLQGPVFTLINHSAKGLSMVWGAAPAEMCRRRRCGGAPGLFAVPGHPRLHDAGGAGHAGVGVAAAHTHPHRSGHPGGTDPSRGGGVTGS
jgi:branched-chain amino acid transport system permease protein